MNKEDLIVLLIVTAGYIASVILFGYFVLSGGKF